MPRVRHLLFVDGRVVVTQKREGDTEDRVLARNAHVAHGSQALWEYAVRMIDDAVGKGHLARKP